MATVLIEPDRQSERRWDTAGRLSMASIIWLLTVCTAAVVALLRGVDADILAPLTVAASIPALISLIISPMLAREWAQVVVILAWLALAITACLAIAFVPMALLFLCAPAAAALFEREKVVEAMVLAAVFAGILYILGQQGVLPSSDISEAGARWGAQAGIVATIMFLITAMFGAASRSNRELHNREIDTFSRADILSAVSGPVLAIDGRDRVDYASREAMDIFGLESDFGVMPATALLSNDPDAAQQLRDLFARVRETNRRQSRSLTTRDRAGITHRLDISVAPVDGPGNDDRLLVQAQDVTDRIAQMEQRRRQRVSDSDTMGSTDQSLFFAGVNHELRTPLNAIIGFSDMMRARMFGPLPGRYAEYADLIHDSGQHMLDLIGDVLDLSKVEAGRYQLSYDIFDAGDVVRSSVKMVRPMADNAEVVIVLDVPEDDVLIEADRKAVRQILLNILSNAVKFSPRGAQVDVALQALDDSIIFSVEDQGPGMSAEEIARIGEPFTQGQSAKLTEERGSGLGLALVNSLTDLHGGTFAIESDETGTLVSATLPRRRASEG